MGCRRWGVTSLRAKPRQGSRTVEVVLPDLDAPMWIGLGRTPVDTEELERHCRMISYRGADPRLLSQLDRLERSARRVGAGCGDCADADSWVLEFDFRELVIRYYAGSEPGDDQPRGGGGRVAHRLCGRHADAILESADGAIRTQPVRSCSATGCADRATVALHFRYQRSVLLIVDLPRQRDPDMVELCEAHGQRATRPDGCLVFDHRSAAGVRRRARQADPFAGGANLDGSPRGQLRSGGFFGPSRGVPAKEAESAADALLVLSRLDRLASAYRNSCEACGSSPRVALEMDYELTAFGVCGAGPRIPVLDEVGGLRQRHDLCDGHARSVVRDAGWCVPRIPARSCSIVGCGRGSTAAIVQVQGWVVWIHDLPDDGDLLSHELCENHVRRLVAKGARRCRVIDARRKPMAGPPYDPAIAMALPRPWELDDGRRPLRVVLEPPACA